MHGQTTRLDRQLPQDRGPLTLYGKLLQEPSKVILFDVLVGRKAAQHDGAQESLKMDDHRPKQQTKAQEANMANQFGFNTTS